MRTQTLFFTFFFCLISLSSAAINFSRINIAWQYDQKFPMKMTHRVVDVEGGTLVFLGISADTVQQWKYELLVQDGYESEGHRALEAVSVDTLIKTMNRWMLKVLLPDLDEDLLIVKFSQPENFYYYDISLKIGKLSYPTIYPVDHNGLPILENYINRSGSLWVGSDTFLIMKYAETFGPADPPMADMKPLAPQVQVDTVYSFAGEVKMEENYFYVLRKDSSATSGVTILRTPPYFPKYRQLGELISSMLYLTSETERKAILRSKNPKQSFDSFWMNTYTTKARARNAIRKYYHWVENANRLFTDYRAGWKSDRGMMYIVYGTPEEVYRTESKEEWYYDNGAAFEFTIISTFFAPKTFTLRRKVDFEEPWYTEIAAIRSGIK